MDNNLNVIDNWELGTVENHDTGEVFMLLKNLKPEIKIGDKNYNYVCYLTFHYNTDNITGLPSIKDSDIFSKIENSELLIFEEEKFSIHLASVTHRGVRDYIFQTSNPDKFLNLSESIKIKYPKYNIQCEILHDPKWSHYIDLPGN